MRKKIALITGGATREYLDPVRYLSNGSSGKMAAALAEAFDRRGFSVTLILGPGAAPCPQAETVPVVSAAEMRREVSRRFPGCDVFISSAAVADFRPRFKSPRKLHRGKKSLFVELVPNPDVLYEMGKRKVRQVCVGFALEDSEGLKNAREKMARKNCDFMVLNDPRSIDSDSISATILSREGKAEKLGKIKKKELAQNLCRRILRRFQKKSSTSRPLSKPI